jgi:NAD(P)-dependent dehydrogenase (short-subunit alcohol dehydrogenase family)
VSAAQRLFDLEGKTALLTGSTRGMGFGIAREFAAHGAKVVVSSRKPEACERARAELAAAGADVFAFACNVAYKDQLQALVGAALERYGAIDILVCNAAANPFFGPLAKISDEAFDKTMGTNVRSNVWLCNMVIPQMAERGGGAVILMSSIAGEKGTRYLGTYAMSKAADSQLARNLAVEWGARNVRVNCLAPGIVRTDFSKALYENPAEYQRALAHYPLGRLGEIDDIVGAAVFLASRAGAFVTGQTIVLDGGMTISGFD